MKIVVIDLHEFLPVKQFRSGERKKAKILRDFCRNAWRLAYDITALRTMAQGVIDQNQRQHRFGNRCGTNADTGIMTPLRRHFDGIAVAIN
jgi:hypothetical protein